MFYSSFEFYNTINMPYLCNIINKFLVNSYLTWHLQF